MKEVIVPDIGEVETVTVAEWTVSEGHQVNQGQEVVVIETMKAAFPLQAPITGKLNQTFVAEGETVEIGQPVAAIRPIESM